MSWRVGHKKLDEVESLFRSLEVISNVDKLVLICTSPEAFGLNSNHITMNDWVIHYVDTEIIRRLGNTNYLGYTIPWGLHLHRCLGRYPWQAFAEKTLTEDFINEYHMMLEAIDEKARIITGLSLVRGYL